MRAEVYVFGLWLVVLLALSACGPRHIGAFTPRERDYRGGRYAQREARNQPAAGSLFSDAVPGYLEDPRAGRLGDILHIAIDENADAHGTSNTQLGRQSNANIGLTGLFGLLPALKRAAPEFDPSQLLAWASSTGFQGRGDTTRSGQLSGTIAVRVVREMPNGDLFVEGTKVVLINNEEYHLYVSGLVRRADISPNNSVPSSRLADAEIEFTGRGDIADQNRRGWLHQALDVVNPF